MAAFQQDRDAVFFRQRLARVVHRGEVLNRPTKQTRGFAEIWGDKSRKWKQIALVNLDRIALQKRVTAGRDHYGIDHEWPRCLAPEGARDFGDNLGRKQKSGFDRRDGEIAEQDFDLFADYRSADR